MKFSLHRPLGLPAVALLLASAACSAPGRQAGPPVPTPPAAQVAPCRALHEELPSAVDGLKRRSTDPASDFTAVWGGGPSVSLRCGVPKPELLKRHPDAETVEVDGVRWVPEQQDDGSVRCTTVLREAWVEITLSKDVPGGFGALSDVAEAVRKTIPEGIAS